MLDPSTGYLRASDGDRIAMAADDAMAPDLTRHFGEPGYLEIRTLARKVRAQDLAGHLGTKMPKNLLFVPGIMGSLLMPKEFGGVWWLDVLRNRDKIDQLGLNPEGEDRDPQHAIEAFQVDQTYDGFLAAAYLDDDFGCERFPFDWRKSLWKSTDSLRTRIEQLCDGAAVKQVHLVGHSMGGLLVRAMLARHPDIWPKIGRIAFLGTPHYGSPAIAFYLKKHFYGTDAKVVLALVLSRSTFRSLFGALTLLPAPIGIYPGTRSSDARPCETAVSPGPVAHPCANFDLYDARAWKLGIDMVETSRLQHVLDHVRDFYAELNRHHFEGLTNDQRARMAMIAGVGQATPFRLTIEDGWKFFGERVGRVTDRVKGDPHREGDGSVPLASASLEHLGETRYILGEHSALPNIPSVYKDVFRWLKGEEAMQLPESPEGALSRHLGTGEEQSIIPNLDGSGDPQGPHGRWDPDIDLGVPSGELPGILDRGDFPEFHRVRIL